MRRDELARRIAGVPPHPAPRPEWEQYRTPDEVAAGLLGAAAADGAIEGRRVLDLGCGTGPLAIGAALLGARSVLGVDVDEEAVRVCKAAAQGAGVAALVEVEVADLRQWHPPAGAFDTVVMNPPFGAQAGNRHADRLFLDRAAEAVRPAGTVWFLAQVRTERFLEAYAGGLEARIERVGVWDYPLLAQFGFHEHEARTLRVGAYRLSW
jgi:putative methylase